MCLWGYLLMVLRLQPVSVCTNSQETHSEHLFDVLWQRGNQSKAHICFRKTAVESTNHKLQYGRGNDLRRMI